MVSPVACQRLQLTGPSPFGNVNFFHRDREKPADDSQSSVQPPPPLSEATPKPDPVKPIQINDEKYVLLLKALRPKDKEAGVLEDLAVDGLRAKAIVGGKSQASPANPPAVSPHEDPGPII